MRLLKSIEKYQKALGKGNLEIFRSKEVFSRLKKFQDVGRRTIKANRASEWPGEGSFV